MPVSSKRERRALGVALDDVGGEQRLVAGAVQVERVVGARGCARSRTRTRRGPTRARAGSRRRPGGRPRRRHRAASTTTSPASSSAGAAIAPGATDARRAPATREQPPAPVILGRVAGVRADDDHAPPAERSVPSSLPRAIRSSRSSIRRVEHRALEARRGLLGGALGRAHALDLGGDQRRHEPQQRPVGGRARGSASAAGRRSPRRPCSSIVVDVVGVAHQRALVGRRARGDREHGRGAVDQDQARVERARRRRAGSRAGRRRPRPRR